MLLENTETNALTLVQNALKNFKVKSKITYGQKTAKYYLTFTEFGRTFVIDYWLGNHSFNVREWAQEGHKRVGRKVVKNMVHREVFTVSRFDCGNDIQVAADEVVARLKKI